MKKHTVEYACICALGNVRRNNEDNFYCDGQIRREIDSNDEVVLSGAVGSDTNELFAVFDGMGGEACGEVASFVAASHSELFARDRGEYEEYLYELAEMLNEKVLEETLARSLVMMGTTAAMIQLAQDDVYVLNAGDSRIYKLASHELRRISRDHTVPAYGGKALTKFLGMPEDHALAPYIASGKYKAGELYMLCTDGVTDMLSDSELQDILDTKRSAAELCRSVVDAALAKGGVDNTTAIILKLLK